MATRRNEIKELQEWLASSRIDQKKQALRKIIDAMTRGKDVSILFMDVLKNMATTDLELKKLIYLYIINYAKILPDLVIMAINIFRKDAQDKTNPLLRALAIRTMGCIRIKQIATYHCDVLKEALKDEDSYVRKAAVICVTKLYDIAPQLMEEQGYLKILENMLNDGNAMVVANTVAGLLYISESKGDLINLDAPKVQRLMTAMNECGEWSQIYILDAITTYTPASSKEAEEFI